MDRTAILIQLQKLKKELKKEGLERIGLFGSWAKGSEDLFSDIDVAIKIRDDYFLQHDAWDYFDLVEKIRQNLTQRFGRKVDLFDLDSASEIKNEIIRDLHDV